MTMTFLLPNMMVRTQILLPIALIVLSLRTAVLPNMMVRTMTTGQMAREEQEEESVQAIESQAINPPLRFSEEDHFTHATQDVDHGSCPSRLAKMKDLSSLY